MVFDQKEVTNVDAPASFVEVIGESALEALKDAETLLMLARQFGVHLMIVNP